MSALSFYVLSATNYNIVAILSTNEDVIALIELRELIICYCIH